MAETVLWRSERNLYALEWEGKTNENIKTILTDNVRPSHR